MSVVPDNWYVRFPDGRIVRADSTSAVRRHIGSGRIPRGSSVRRSGDEEWVSLEWAKEFADLLKSSSSPQFTLKRPAAQGKRDGRRSDRPASGSISSRLDPVRLRTLGMRGVLQELLAALDSTLVHKKLLIGLFAGVVFGVLLALAPVVERLLSHLPSAWLLVWSVTAVILLLVGTVAAVLISQLTYVELCRLRAAKWREGTAGLGRTAARVMVALLSVVGGAIGLLWVLQAFPGWVVGNDTAPSGVWREVTAAAVSVLAQFFAVLIVPWTVFALLLTPILLVEECSILSCWSQWRQLLRKHRGQALCWEALAVSIGVVASLPLLLPWLVMLTLNPAPTDSARIAVAFTRQILAALAVTPLAVYLIVANVFIYLNLRYEASTGRR
jgi:hypothetical protein